MDGQAEPALERATRAVAIRDELGSLEEDEREVFLVLVDALQGDRRPLAAAWLVPVASDILLSP